VLRDRGPTDVEVGGDVARRTLRIPDQAQDLAAARLGDGFESSLHVGM
jgi:hypothetical protein